MTIEKRLPKILPSPLKGTLSDEDIRPAVLKVKAAREAREQGAQSGPEHARQAARTEHEV